jgi:hypothetical protein
MNLAVECQDAPNAERGTTTCQVVALLSRLNPGVTIERRRHERIAVPVLFRLTPLDEDRQPVDHESTIVVGKNISHRGLCFIHDRPLLYRRARVTLAQPGLGYFDVEMDISWCRFTRPGWYESGGRLVRSTVPRVDPSDCSTVVSLAGV